MDFSAGFSILNWIGLYLMQRSVILTVLLCLCLPHIAGAQDRASDSLACSGIQLQTNLLYDALLAPNISLALPIGNKWSINASFTNPWWVARDNSWCYQILHAEVEARRWLGNRDSRPLLTGSAIGIYFGGGYYDLEYNSKGFQGGMGASAGISYHWAKCISRNKRWRIELGLGLGAIHTKFKHYEGRKGNTILVWLRDDKYLWIGPTKASVSIAYLINWKSKKRDRQ